MLPWGGLTNLVKTCVRHCDTCKPTLRIPCVAVMVTVWLEFSAQGNHKVAGSSHLGSICCSGEGEHRVRPYEKPCFVGASDPAIDSDLIVFVVPETKLEPCSFCTTLRSRGVVRAKLEPGGRAARIRELTRARPPPHSRLPPS
jgi:hypothetical protein